MPTASGTALPSGCFTPGEKIMIQNIGRNFFQVGEGFEWKNVHPNGYVFVASISAISKGFLLMFIPQSMVIPICPCAFGWT